ncbi:MAG TPA: HAMP domain-containing histidine kinase [Peptococcaceae bacterium]|nr:HAMP domain-containing histidine kinase [Peptococcaceae bacterium]
MAVQDTGPGIAPDHLERIFEQFYQGKPTAAGRSESKGIGHGLYICKQIVEKHNGRIWA